MGGVHRTRSVISRRACTCVVCISQDSALAVLHSFLSLPNTSQDARPTSADEHDAVPLRYPGEDGLDLNLLSDLRWHGTDLFG